MYDIVISAPRDDHPIYSGMNARVNITLDTRENVLVIPLTAVSEDPMTGESVVNVIQPNGSIVKTPIITGMTKYHQVEVLEGLTEGQKLQMIDFDANTYSHEDFTSPYFY